MFKNRKVLQRANLTI